MLTPLVDQERPGTIGDLFTHMRTAVVHLRFVFEDGRPVDAVYLGANPAFLNRTGLRDPIGRRVSEMYPRFPEWKPVSFDLAAEVAASGVAASREGYADHLGEWLSMTAYCPRPGEAVVQFDKITERKRAEQALHRSERRLRAIFDDAAIGIALIERSGAIIQVNPAFASALGRAPETLLERRFRELVHPDDAELVCAMFAALASAGEGTRVAERRLLRADGATVHARMTLSSTLDDAGQLESFVMVIEDVGAQRAAEAQSALLSAQLQALFQHAEVGIIVTRIADRQIVEWNPLFERLTGIPRSEAIGTTTDRLNFYASLEDRERLYRELAANGQAPLRRVRIRRRDGVETEVAASVTLAEVRGEQCALAVIFDVSAVERAEAEARRANDRFGALFSAAAVPMAICDVATNRLLAVNDAYCALVGYDRETLTGWTWREVVQPENRADGEAAVAKLRAGEINSHTRVSRVIRRDGQVRWVRTTVSVADPGARPPTTFVAVLDDITAWREVEATRALQDQALQVVEDAVILCRPSGIIEWTNIAASQLDGFAPGELIGKSVSVFDARIDDEPIMPSLRAALLAGRTWSGVVDTRRKDGTRYPAELTVTPVLGPDGAMTHSIAFRRDLTERTRTVEALRSALARMRLSLDAAEQGTWLHDLREGRVLLDERARIILGFDRQDVAFEELMALVSIELRDDIERRIREATAPGGSGRASTRHRLRRPDGVERWVDVHVLYQFEERDGVRVARYESAIIRDITEQQHALAAIQVSEERYRQLVEHLDDVVYTVDHAGRVTFVSRAIERFGYRPDEVIGHFTSEFVHPDDVQPFRSAATIAARGVDRPASAGPTEFRLIDKSGRARPVRGTARPLFAEGVVVGATGVIVDQTSQRAIEEQLRAAQKMEAVGRLAGGVAHDFNNLLSVILSYSESALDQLREEDPLRDEIQEVTHAATRAAALTRQLLAFSRKQVFEIETLRLGELIGGLARMLRRVIGEDIALTIDEAPELPPVRADRGQLEQVVMNLVVNARDAMPTGGKLTVSIGVDDIDSTRAGELELAAGRYVVLSVADDGCGMDEATRARIFEPFFTTKEVGKGTGLGLSTVYGIVKQSHGAIAVESAPGRGSTFRVYLPAHAPARAALAAHATPPPIAQSTARETVLVVEDEEALRSVLVRVLREAGYQVLAAANGVEACTLVEQPTKPVDLLLTDVVMPAMNGFDLAQRLSAERPSMKVLFTSGYHDAVERHEHIAYSFMAKPFDRRSLLRKVRELLDAARFGAGALPENVASAHRRP